MALQACPRGTVRANDCRNRSLAQLGVGAAKGPGVARRPQLAVHCALAACKGLEFVVCKVSDEGVERRSPLNHVFKRDVLSLVALGLIGQVLQNAPTQLAAGCAKAFALLKDHAAR